MHAVLWSMSYEEEDACMSYEEEDACMPDEEEGYMHEETGKCSR